jgi:hypothetical protein
VAELGAEFGEGDIAGAGDVAGGELFRWANVEEEGGACAEAPTEFGEGDGFGGGSGAVGADDAVDFGEVGFAAVAEGAEELADGGSGEGVEDLEALFAGLDEAGGAEGLEVLGGVGDGEAAEAGEVLDGAFALGEEVEDFEAGGVGEGVAYAGELGEEGLLRAGGHLHLFKRILE